MNEDKKELLENELEKVADGKTRRASLEKDLSDEDREKLKEVGRDVLDNLMIKIVQGFVEQKGRYNTQISVLAKDPDKFTEYLRSNKSTYGYYEKDIFGVLEYLGEEEFKKIVKRCSF